MVDSMLEKENIPALPIGDYIFQLPSAFIFARVNSDQSKEMNSILNQMPEK